MDLTPELWDRVVEADSSLRLEGKSLTPARIKHMLNVSSFEAKCLRFSLKHKGIIASQYANNNPSVDMPLKRRILLMGDTHCGHMAGLTPPPYQLQLDHPKFDGFANFQRETWEWFVNEIEKLKPFDIVVANGDLIDGKGQASGGTELLTSDRTIQCQMAQDILDYIGARKIVMTYGTPYHAGKEEDFEGMIATAVRAEAIKNELNLDVDGVMINAKHETKGSSVPYGAATPPLKDQLYQSFWAEFEDRRAADIIVRSHVHEYLKIENRRGSVIVLPALQGAMTKYGGRRCVKVVDYGFAYVDIFEDGTYSVEKVLFRPETQKSKVIIL